MLLQLIVFELSTLEIFLIGSYFLPIAASLLLQSLCLCKKVCDSLGSNNGVAKTELIKSISMLMEL